MASWLSWSSFSIVPTIDAAIVYELQDSRDDDDDDDEEDDDDDDDDAEGASVFLVLLVLHHLRFVIVSIVVE